MNRNNVPSLEGMLFEYNILNGLADITIKRIEGGEKLPEYIYKTVVIPTRAYIIIAKKYFPNELNSKIATLKGKAEKLKELYNYAKNDIAAIDFKQTS